MSTVIVTTSEELKNIVNMAVLEALAKHSNTINQKEDKVLTVKEAAKSLNCCTKTVLNLISVGKLPAINKNRGSGRRAAYRVMDSDVKAFLKRQRA